MKDDPLMLALIIAGAGLATMVTAIGFAIAERRRMRRYIRDKMNEPRE